MRPGQAPLRAALAYVRYGDDPARRRRLALLLAGYVFCCLVLAGCVIAILVAVT